MQEIYQPVEWVAEQLANERIATRHHHVTQRGRGRAALARGLRRLADSIDG